MKRSRTKVVGLGLALFAGQLRAVADEPAVAPAGGIVVPRLLPTTVRVDTGPTWAPSTVPASTDPIWMAPRRATPTPQPVTAPSHVVVAPPAIPIATAPPTGTIAQVQAATPPPSDTRTSPLAPLPVIPQLPDGPITLPPSNRTAPAPAADAWQPAQPRTEAAVNLEVPQDPAPPPRKLDTPMSTPSQPLTKPRPVELPNYPEKVAPAAPPVVTPAQAELPCAPQELLMRPVGTGVPGHWGTFGSPPISLSRDYPACRDILENCGLDGFSLFAPPSGGPATDRLFFGVEYLMWWMNSPQIPVLASTSTNGGFGFLGQPGTQTLLGPGSFGDSLRHGMRVRAGAWFDDCGTCGIDGSFFFLGRNTTSATFDSGSTPTITRPIFAPNINSEFGEVVAFPGRTTGTLSVDMESELWGADVNLRHALCRKCDFRHEVFVGYRFLSLREMLTITESITALSNPPDVPGTQVVVQDSFRTRNSFHGGQIGGLLERKWGRVSLETRASVALGATIQDLDIVGFQSRLRPGMTTPDTFSGGLLAAGPNLGHFSKTRFSVVPEVTVNLGYWITPTWKIYGGYNMLYWSNVIRPGDQIDRTVDLSFVPNVDSRGAPAGATTFSQNRPLPTFKQSDMWVNGIQFGMEFRW